MDHLRGLLILPAVLIVGIIGLVAALPSAIYDLARRCLRRETLDERLDRMYPGMHVRTFDDIADWQEPT